MKRTNKDDYIAEANRFRTSHFKVGGVVLFFDSRAYGWKDTLRDPEHERPGVIAVDAEGDFFRAGGGNDYDGARTWFEM